MNTAVTAPAVLTPVRVPVIGWVAALGAVVLMYLAFNENGVLLTQSWEYLHEFFHDGRHVFGVPCH